MIGTILAKSEPEKLQKLVNNLTDKFEDLKKVDQSKQTEYKRKIKWINLIALTYIHVAGIYGCCLFETKFKTVCIAYAISLLAGFGVTVGSHRYFAHKSFKANQKLKVFLVMIQTLSGLDAILLWARDHRGHHKYTDTNADYIYSSSRSGFGGFFFSHIGNLMVTKHPDVVKYGKRIDMSDLENDPILLFQKKYWIPLTIFAVIFLPVTLMYYFSGDTFYNVWYCNMARHMLTLNSYFLASSAAHTFGTKPYDKNCTSTDSKIVGMCLLGEGWHNFHHIFANDYRASDRAGYLFNLSAGFIDFFAWLGWATELKTTPEHVIRKRVLRTGDGTHEYSQGEKLKKKL